MKKPAYDIAIVGAGVVGAAIARMLSAYKLKVALLDRCADVGFGVSKANSGIIHSGVHHSLASLKARLEIQGNLMFEKLHHELNFPFRRVGHLVVAFSEEEMKTVEHLYRQGRENGVPGLALCSGERIRAMEPGVNPDTVGGLYAPSGGIVEPYRLVFSLVECAVQNGVDLYTEFEVQKARRTRSGFALTSAGKENLQARFVINAAGLYADRVSRILGAERFRIHPRKGEEYLLDRNAKAYPRQVLFPVPSPQSKGMLVIPTVDGTTMIGPTAEDVQDKADVETSAANLERVFVQAKHMVPRVSRRDIIASFAGLRPALPDNDFLIRISKRDPRIVQVAGIQSPGLTAAPAIADFVKNLLKQAGLSLTEKRKFRPGLPRTKSIRCEAGESLSEWVRTNRDYGHIACRCESVSDAEIRKAIRKGHTTLDGIKFYTRAGMGRCQGGFCTYRVMKILIEETGMKPWDITKRGGDSFVVLSQLGGDG